MKRTLTHEEKKLTHQGIERVIKEAETYVDEMILWEKLEEYRKVKRSFDDFMRPITRKKEDKELANARILTESKIKDCDKNVREMRKHIREGVEVKEKK